MPVILEPEQFGPWLERKAGLEVLKPASNDALQRWPALGRVNSSRTADDDATL
jgi:putative SOS response-associated peptidase YedK